MPTVPITVYVTLGPEVHEQMFRSGGQSDAKPPVFSSQASMVLVYGTHCKDERLKGFEPRTCGVGGSRWASQINVTNE
ncbi:hypothetical protein TNCV_223221 [Trichonephila clavipes]|nr:hypothetical protein TNCV_223221 [Trichonephila clavipes]